jgi:hypothetical protein
VANADDYLGLFRAHDGEPLELVADGEGHVFVRRDGRSVRTRRRWDDGFLVEHPELERFLLEFERDDEGLVTAAHHGPSRWHRRTPDDDPAPMAGDLSPFEGHYRSHNPWNSNFRVVLREGRLVCIHALGFEDPMIPLGPNHFRLGEDEGSPERISFDAVVEGRALRANRSGCDYYRAFTP